MFAPWKKSYDQPIQHIKIRYDILPTKFHRDIAMVFSVVMYGCESWTTKESEPNNWCFWTMVLGKTLESHLDCKVTQPVNPKGNQYWIFIGRTGAEGEAPIIWPREAKNWFIWKDPDVGQDWRQEEKGTMRMRCLDCSTNSMDMFLTKLQELVMERVAWHAEVHGLSKSQTLLSDWTELNWNSTTLSCVSLK